MSQEGQKKHRDMDFGIEVAKIMPLILREITKKQAGFITKGVLTVPQIVVLDLLLEKRSCRMNELAKVLGFTMSAVTPIVDKMIGLKLLKRQRSSEDRRVVNVMLSDKGRQTARQIRQERRNIINTMFLPLTEEERNEYLRLLRKVYGNLRRGQ